MFFPMFLSSDVAKISQISLVGNLAIVMLAAGIVAALFHWRGWPKVIGYICAGALLTKLNEFMPWITETLHLDREFRLFDQSSIDVLSSIGIIVLMFTLGLELNVRKLKRLGGTVFPTATWDFLVMILLGFLVGRYCFGWGVVPSLFLGAVICDSSTTLLAKSLEDMGCSKTKFAAVIFGTTVTEDVMTIGLMAILTGLALSGKFQAGELLRQLSLLGAFLVGVLIFGLLFLPKFLDKMIARLKDDETVLMIVLGICFGISLIAEWNNFSLALGAFLVGAVVAESRVWKRVFDQTSGLRTMFSAVFFVTIGLKVNLVQMWDNKWAILLVTIVVLVGKTVNCATMSFITGQTFRESILIGVGLAQLGDFAYLVALLGMRLTGGTEPYPEMYQIAVGVSVITTLLNPVVLPKTGDFADWLLRHMPKQVSEGLAQYSEWSSRTGQELSERHKGSRALRLFVYFMLNLVVLAAIVFGFHELCKSHAKALMIAQENIESLPRLLKFDWVRAHYKLLYRLVANMLAIPLVLNGYRLAKAMGGELSEALGAKYSGVSWQGKMKALVKTSVRLIFWTILLFVYIVSNIFLFSDYGGKMLFVVLIIIVLVVIYLLVRRRLHSYVLDARDTLSAVLNREDDEEPEEVTDTLASVVKHKFELIIPEKSGAVGVTFGRLRLRNHTGASVVKIVREDGEVLENPGSADAFHAGDLVTFLGDDAAEAKVNEFLSHEDVSSFTATLTMLMELHVEKMKIEPDSPVAGHRLADLRLRNKTGATVVQIVRSGRPIGAVPGPEDVLLEGDLVSFLGTNEQLRAVREMIAVDVDA